MFVVYLSSNEDIDDYHNYYGYFSGKCYTKEGLVFPVTDSGITERTKKYTSGKNALKGAEAVYNKSEYVLSYRIEEV